MFIVVSCVFVVFNLIWVMPVIFSYCCFSVVVVVVFIFPALVVTFFFSFPSVCFLMGYFLNGCIFFCEDSFDLVWFRGVLRYVFTICSVCILLNILLYFFIGENTFWFSGSRGVFIVFSKNAFDVCPSVFMAWWMLCYLLLFSVTFFCKFIICLVA